MMNITLIRRRSLAEYRANRKNNLEVARLYYSAFDWACHECSNLTADELLRDYDYLSRSYPHVARIVAELSESAKS